MEQRRKITRSERRGKGEGRQEEEEKATREAEMAVHSRVRKIKRESEKIVDWWPDLLETRPHLRGTAPSPLGLSGKAIAIGDS